MGIRRSRQRARRGFVGMAFACMVMAGVSPGQDTESRPDRERDLTDLSLDALVDIEISSVSKHLERLRDAPAAIYAITDDDLRRSGAHSIAELQKTPLLKGDHR